MNRQVYTKTTEGFREMQLRQARLHPRVRSLLILIDGKQCVDDLCGKFSTPALVQEYLGVLHEKGLIEPVIEKRDLRPKLAAPPLTEQQSLPPANRLERMAAIAAILGDILEECFGAEAALHAEALARARHMRELVAIANTIITHFNQSGRIEQAVQFKQRVRPLLR